MTFHAWIVKLCELTFRNCSSRMGGMCPTLMKSFACAQDSPEKDVRFSYCAFAIAYMLHDWSMMDKQAAIQYLLRCQHYESAFAQEPGLESHAGSTYCVVAALCLADNLNRIPCQPALERWVLSRQCQSSGFQGRPEKEPDTCYSFWCGASAKILGCHDKIDGMSDVNWILSAASPMGGIAKVPSEMPDILHSYLSIVALAMHAEDGVWAQDAPFARASGALNLSYASLNWIYTHLWSAPPEELIP